MIATIIIYDPIFHINETRGYIKHKMNPNGDEFFRFQRDYNFCMPMVSFALIYVAAPLENHNDCCMLHVGNFESAWEIPGLERY